MLKKYSKKFVLSLSYPLSSSLLCFYLFLTLFIPPPLSFIYHCLPLSVSNTLSLSLNSFLLNLYLCLSPLYRSASLFIFLFILSSLSPLHFHFPHFFFHSIISFFPYLYIFVSFFRHRFALTSQIDY